MIELTDDRLLPNMFQFEKCKKNSGTVHKGSEHLQDSLWNLTVQCDAPSLVMKASVC
jgi:hypothetical protein